MEADEIVERRALGQAQESFTANRLPRLLAALREGAETIEHRRGGRQLVGEPSAVDAFDALKEQAASPGEALQDALPPGGASPGRGIALVRGVGQLGILR